MNKQIYIGGTPLIDLTGYATEQYVQTAVDNVDVTDQLQNYVLKTALDSSIAAVDASLVAADASINALKSTLADIVSDGSADTVINTWAEMKAFLADYTTASDLSTLINTVKEQAVEDASADAAGKYQPIGSYLVADDISTFVDAAAVAGQINSSIAALDLPNTYQTKGDYLVADDISTFVTDSSLTTNYYQKGAVNDMMEVISNSINSLSTAVDGKIGPNDISTFVDAAAVASAINSSIAALDLANTYQAKGDYATSDDISTFVDAAAVSGQINSSIAALNLSQYAKDASLADYMTINDASNHVQSADVMHIVKCTSTAYAAIEEKDPKTLYIVTD